ncbi:MAG: hypothetical protein K6C99_04260 [Lachnospiraceae bacterium]|nr:hypothetical protein [Lachnospiraceae bacterium]
MGSRIRLIIFFVVMIIVDVQAVLMMVSPDWYRDFIAKNPGWDPYGKMTDASDGTIRKQGAITILISVAVAAIILKVVGII